MLKIFALNVSDVMVSFSTNIAVPKLSGRTAPVLVLRRPGVGGFSCEVVRFAAKVVTALALVAGRSTARQRNNAVRNRSIRHLPEELSLVKIVVTSLDPSLDNGP